MKKLFSFSRTLVAVAAFFNCFCFSPVVDINELTASAEVMSPNIANAFIRFEPLDAKYLYTGNPIIPEFTVSLTFTLQPDVDYSYKIISSDDNEKGTSAGINPGTVTFEIEGTGSFASGYYGKRTASFYIEKAGGLRADDVDLTIYSSGTFDLDSISLSKSDCGARLYSLGEKSDSDSILSDVSINGSTLQYKATGASGIANQTIIITTDNYEDVEILISFNAQGSYDAVDNLKSLKNYILGISNNIPFDVVDIDNDNAITAMELVAMKREIINGNRLVFMPNPQFVEFLENTAREVTIERMNKGIRILVYNNADDPSDSMIPRMKMTIPMGWQVTYSTETEFVSPTTVTSGVVYETNFIYYVMVEKTGGFIYTDDEILNWYLSTDIDDKIN